MVSILNYIFSVIFVFLTGMQQSSADSCKSVGFQRSLFKDLKTVAIEKLYLHMLFMGPAVSYSSKLVRFYDDY